MAWGELPGGFSLMLGSKTKETAIDQRFLNEIQVDSYSWLLFLAVSGSFWVRCSDRNSLLREGIAQWSTREWLRGRCRGWPLSPNDLKSVTSFLPTWVSWYWLIAGWRYPICPMLNLSENFQGAVEVPSNYLTLRSSCLSLLPVAAREDENPTIRHSGAWKSLGSGSPHVAGWIPPQKF